MLHLTLYSAVKAQDAQLTEAIQQAIEKSLSELGEGIKSLEWANVSVASQQDRLAA